MRYFKRIGLRSITGPNPGGARKDRRFPSPSKTVRGGTPPFHSSTNMQESSLPPTIIVAARGIMHLHLEMMPCEAMHLRNQVICMIAEYHLTSSAQGPSSLSLVLLEVATTLLPPIKDYVPGIAFEGTRDVRVVDHARTLQVAAWLHWLDISTRGDEMASETLEASRHSQGPLLDLFLNPMTSNLTFKEVVDRILYENWRDAQSSLNDLRAHCAHIHKVLDDLTKAHGEESDKSS